jgi:two-component system sensor histidine kinase UhpB
MNDDQRLLKRMLVSAINAREAENRRAARILHDQVGQILTAVGLQLQVLNLDFGEGTAGLSGRIQETLQALDVAMEQVRSLSYDLNPAVVERAGLQAALDRLVGRFRSLFDGTIRFAYDSTVQVPHVVAEAWYRIAELSIDNAIRHAAAQRIELHVRRQGSGAALEVRDDGRGFHVEEGKRMAGLGLLLIDHYTQQANVRTDLTSSPGLGTVIRSEF